MIGLGDLLDLPPEWETPEMRRQLTLINAKLDLLSGITTVRDLGATDSLFEIRNEINSGKQMDPVRRARREKEQPKTHTIDPSLRRLGTR